MTFGSTSYVIGPVADIPGLIPHEVGRAESPFHDAFKTLPIGGAVGVHVKITAGTVQPFFIVRRQLARQRR